MYSSSMPEAASTPQWSTLLSPLQRIEHFPWEHRRFFAKALVTVWYITTELSIYKVLNYKMCYIALTIFNTTKEKTLACEGILK